MIGMIEVGILLSLNSRYVGSHEISCAVLCIDLKKMHLTQHVVQYRYYPMECRHSRHYIL